LDALCLSVAEWMAAMEEGEAEVAWGVGLIPREHTNKAFLICSDSLMRMRATHLQRLTQLENAFPAENALEC